MIQEINRNISKTGLYNPSLQGIKSLQSFTKPVSLNSSFSAIQNNPFPKASSLYFKGIAKVHESRQRERKSADEAFNTIIRGIKEGKKILFFTDYDGTLVDYISGKSMPLAKETLNSLENMAKKENIKTNILTGRSIDELIQLSGIDLKNTGITLLGKDGGEYLQNGRIKTILNPEQQEKINVSVKKLEKTFNELLSSYKQVIEPYKSKTYPIAYYIKQDVPGMTNLECKKLGQEFTRKFIPVLRKEGFILSQDGLISRVFHNSFEKSGNILKIIAKYEKQFGKDSCLAVFVGDGSNDEKALKTVEHKGGVSIAIKEGTGEYQANRAEYLNMLSKLAC